MNKAERYLANNTNVRWQVGIETIESVSCITQIPYKIAFHPAYSIDKIHIDQSHGVTYEEGRQILNGNREKSVMGLDHLCLMKLIVNRDIEDFYKVTEKDNPLTECRYICDGIERPTCYNMIPARKENE